MTLPVPILDQHSIRLDRTTPMNWELLRSVGGMQPVTVAAVNLRVTSGPTTYATGQFILTPVAPEEATK